MKYELWMRRLKGEWNTSVDVPRHGGLMADSCWCLIETTKFCKAIILQLKDKLKKKINWF